MLEVSANLFKSTFFCIFSLFFVRVSNQKRRRETAQLRTSDVVYTPVLFHVV